MSELRVRVVGDKDASGAPVVVLLHGFGAPGDDLVSLARELNVAEGTRFVFPEALLDLGPMYMGGRAWWYIDLEERMRREAKGEPRNLDEVPEGLSEARDAVNTLLDHIEQTMKPSKLVLGGFSQGAMLSLDVALRSSRALAGIVLMSGTHIARGEWAPLLSGRKNLPTFMSHGTEDPILPFQTSLDLKGTLAAAGWPIDWISFRGGHGIPRNVLIGVSTFLSRVL